MRLSKIFFLAIICFLQACSPIQTVTVVRHGEKTADGKSLSPEGILRAQSLKNILSAKKIDSVYSTNTVRTISTAQPTADNKGLPVTLYKNNTEMLSILAAGKKNGQFLIVGHSNTVPDLLRLCGCDYKKKDLDDNEYKKLFVMTLRGNKCKLKESIY